MKSILIYFIFYAVVILFTFIVEKMLKKNKFHGILLMLIPVLLMSWFAGARDFSVGTDVTVYGIQHFNRCFWPAMNFTTYLSHYGGEYLYYSIVYIVSLFTNNYHIVLFIFQLILSGLIFKIAYDNRKKCSMTFVITVYLLIWYNSSLNLLRQSPAILIMFYALKFLQDDKYFKYIVCMLIAMLFHSSAITCILFLFLRILSKTKKSKRNIAISCLVLMLFFLTLDKTMYIFVSLSIFPSNYMNYVTSSGSLHVKYFIVKLLMFGCVYLFQNALNYKNKNEILLPALYYEVILYFSSFFITYGYRTSYYFVVCYILFIPTIDSYIKSKKGKLIYRSVMLAMLLGHWLIRYYIIGYDGVIPFSF